MGFFGMKGAKKKRPAFRQEKEEPDELDQMEKDWEQKTKQDKEGF